MTMWNALLIFSGCVAVMIAICAVSIWWRKSGGPERYDERQKAAHGEAYQVSTLVSVGYYLLLAIAYGLQKDSPQYSIDPYLGIMGGIMLQAMLYHIYCLLTHSYLPLGQKPLGTIGGYAVLGFMHFSDGYSWYETHGHILQLTGDGTSGTLQLISGVCFLCLAVMHLIAVIWKEKE